MLLCVALTLNYHFPLPQLFLCSPLSPGSKVLTPGFSVWKDERLSPSSPFYSSVSASGKCPMLSENPYSAPPGARVAGEGPRCPKAKTVWWGWGKGVEVWTRFWLWAVSTKSSCAVGSLPLDPLSATQLVCGQSSSVMPTILYQGEKACSNSILETPRPHLSGTGKRLPGETSYVTKGLFAQSCRRSLSGVPSNT